MTTICIVRHGQTDWNVEKRLQGQTDIPLNDIGRQQARKAGEILRLSFWNRIISSPLARARETADIIHRSSKNFPAVELRDEFMERSFGKAEGLSRQEREERYPDEEFVGGEEMGPFIARVMSGIENLRHECAGERVMLVTHGAVINAIIGSIAEEGFEYGVLQNACLSEIEWEGSTWRIRTCNETGHLADRSDNQAIV